MKYLWELVCKDNFQSRKSSPQNILYDPVQVHALETEGDRTDRTADSKGNKSDEIGICKGTGVYFREDSIGANDARTDANLF